jgi:glutathione S-transferase
MRKLERKFACILALRDSVAQRPGIAAYPTAERRLPFAREGIFRHYPERND